MYFQLIHSILSTWIYIKKGPVKTGSPTKSKCEKPHTNRIKLITQGSLNMETNLCNNNPQILNDSFTLYQPRYYENKGNTK